MASVALPAEGAGFGIFQQGAKAMGMAGAFTAQADDPSALFHNVGGIAHQKERAFQLGATLIGVSSSDFVGSPPGIAVGTTAESEPLLEVPPHFYWVEPMGDRLTFGLSVNSPFGLTSEWTEPEFPGRYISRMASLVSYDVSSNLGWKASDTIGIGFGAIVRYSEVELEVDLPSFDPGAGQVVDVAHLASETDLEAGFGFQLGVSSHPNPSWSWGFSYRSAIEIDYAGSGRLRQILTGNRGLDDLIAATIPFDQDLPVTTAIEFPDMASVGLAVKPSRDWLIEVDVNWAGWSTLTAYDIRFPQNPEFDRVYRQDWEDVYSYRLGASRSTARGEWRFGFSFDETPLSLGALGPLLPDGDQTAITLGYGFEAGTSTVDLALMAVDIGKRRTTVSFEDFNGSFESSGLLFASTVTW
ncbi:MAG: OmpP1/FadL family transporter [Thermoanaerobaculia bacterium]